MINVQLPSVQTLKVHQLEPKSTYLCVDLRDGEQIIGATDENRNFIVFHSVDGGYDAGYNLTHHIDDFSLQDDFTFNPVNLEIKASFK